MYINLLRRTRRIRPRWEISYCRFRKALLDLHTIPPSVILPKLPIPWKTWLEKMIVSPNSGTMRKFRHLLQDENVQARLVIGFFVTMFVVLTIFFF